MTGTVWPRVKEGREGYPSLDCPRKRQSLAIVLATQDPGGGWGCLSILFYVFPAGDITFTRQNAT